MAGSRKRTDQYPGEDKPGAETVGTMTEEEAYEAEVEELTEEEAGTGEPWRVPERLSLAARRAGAAMGPASARAAVSAYYQLQRHRIRLGNQLSRLVEAGESDEVIRHFYEAALDTEKDAGSVLGYWAKNDPVGEWALSICGVGPVLAAGLLAHIDIEHAPTVGHIWSFAGLDPNVKWEKGQKRPWNAQLKVLCWKLGDSFVKVSNRPNDTYGHIYRDRKAQEQERNERGDYAELAAKTLAERKITEPTTRAWYEQGKLPPGRIELRSRRVAVKLFLAHLHAEAYRQRYGKEPPLPYGVVVKPGGEATCVGTGKRIFTTETLANDAILKPEAMHSYKCTLPNTNHWHLGRS